MNKIYKILGKRGRITIPFEIRMALGFAYNDVVSFEVNDRDVLIRREKVCDGCNAVIIAEPVNRAAALQEVFDSLTSEELRTALIHLSVRWAQMQEGGAENA